MNRPNAGLTKKPAAAPTKSIMKNRTIFAHFWFRLLCCYAILFILFWGRKKLISFTTSEKMMVDLFGYRNKCKTQWFVIFFLFGKSLLSESCQEDCLYAFQWP